MDIKVLNGEYQYKFNKTRYEACIKKAQRRVNKYNMNLRKYRQLAKMWTKAFYVSLGFAAIPLTFPPINSHHDASLNNYAKMAFCTLPERGCK